jgi:predicted ribosomally synthesized peptide with nif11-like leader
MSQTHIEKFYEIAANDQALLGQLISDTSSPEEFVENVVAAAKERGLSFSAEEANTWIAAQQATKANDELSDTQLEGVAGGKGGTMDSIDKAMDSTDSAAKSGISRVSSVTNPVVTPVYNWFQSW